MWLVAEPTREEEATLQPMLLHYQEKMDSGPLNGLEPTTKNKQEPYLCNPVSNMNQKQQQKEMRRPSSATPSKERRLSLQQNSFSIEQRTSTPINARAIGNALAHSPVSPIPKGLGNELKIQQLGIWANGNSQTHTLAEIDDRTVSINDVLYLDELSLGEARYPGLSQMYDELNCQFLHASIKLAIPAAEVYLPTAFDTISTHMSLIGNQDVPLELVYKTCGREIVFY